MKESHILIHTIIDEIEKVVIGKREKIELAMAAFLSGGHLLIEDMPGVGKTTLAKALAHVLGLEFGRIQFTSDLLPADIIGVNYFDVKSGEFRFKKGPIFSSILLADEINRATPKTQSALLEAMAEHQVSVENETYLLDEPFFVIATKNPYEESGVFTMPSSQLDRFVCTISLGYADRASEREILRQGDLNRAQALKTFPKEEVMHLLALSKKVHVSDAILDLIQSIIEVTREQGLFVYGLSTRGALALLQLSKAYALIRGRDFVTPNDVTNVLEPVVIHRLELTNRDSTESAAKKILALICQDC
ncbi:MAG: MoxR family ATPase [Helicobacteraceae bacterium]|nr:MoxR family ATPase [Helicobacteraceae bacterium]